MSPQEYFNKLRLDIPHRHSFRCRYGSKRTTETPSCKSGKFQDGSSSQQSYSGSKTAWDEGRHIVGDDDDSSSEQAVDDNGPGGTLDNYVYKSTLISLGGASDRDRFFPRTMSCCSCCFSGGDRSDAQSMMSFSTNATMDDNIGAGRTLDKYVYQPVGRWLERITSKWLSKDRDVYTESTTSFNPDPKE